MKFAPMYDEQTVNNARAILADPAKSNNPILKWARKVIDHNEAEAANRAAHPAEFAATTWGAWARSDAALRPKKAAAKRKKG
jgi:hypothetical protein